jgi:hypothetical protein
MNCCFFPASRYFGEHLAVFQAIVQRVLRNLYQTKLLILYYKFVRPDGFEPPTPWFEDAYSDRRKSLENKAFWHFGLCYKTASYPLIRP